MIRVNLATGETLSIDLGTDDGAQTWARMLDDDERSHTIRGIGIVAWGVAHQLPQPSGFDRVRWDVEFVRDDQGRTVRESVICYCGVILVSVSAYHKTRMVRTDVRRVGRLRFRPPAG